MQRTYLRAVVWFVAHKNLSYYKVTSGSMEPTLQIGQRVAAAGMAVSGALAAIKISAGLAGHPAEAASVKPKPKA